VSSAPRATEWPRAATVSSYFVLYWAYLWLHPESELLHWASLVVLPTLGLFLMERAVESPPTVRAVTRRLGLRWPEANRGIVLMLALIALVQLIQLLNASLRADVFRVLASPAAVWMVPSALLLMVVTAGFTEEYFFRGILQRSLSGRFGSDVLGVLMTTLAFSVYHIPYAYLNPNWPSHGDLGQAVGLAFLNGTLGGVILGVLFVRCGSSLLPCILLHAAVNWMPAIRMMERLQFGA